ncbi:hypothetical protein BDK62_11356 [Halomonas alkaliantarctica]|nr:hypothetical protein BDK62_11356 [Halomonas alkaliantarctica]
MPSSPFSILNIRYDTMTFHKKSVKKNNKTQQSAGFGQAS